MSYLSKDDIWKADDRPVRDVEVPEWDGVVRVRALSGGQRDEYESSLRETIINPKTGVGTMVANTLNARAKLASLSIVDGDGNQMFSELEVARLGLKSAPALDRVVKAATELSGLTETAVEDAAGNSEAAPSGGSGTN